MLCSPQLLLPSLAVLLYGGGVIDRYTRPEMGRIWSEESKYQAWLRVELAVCEAYARRGRIPADAMARIRQRARVDVARILVSQERVKHEMIALLTSLEEQVGEDSRCIHIGLTTSDGRDTATALQLRDAVDLLIDGQVRLDKPRGLLALPAASREKSAVEVRGLQRTEGLEAQEPCGEGQKGSSAMPHKRNPELAERVCGLARLVRTNALAALENVALWHERDISHSSVERVILPDSTIVLDYLLHLTTFVVEGLDVDTARMTENLELSHGLVYSQRVLLKLTGAGLPRQVAYEIVQRHAMRAWKERRPFFELLAADSQGTAQL